MQISKNRENIPHLKANAYNYPFAFYEKHYLRYRIFVSKAADAHWMVYVRKTEIAPSSSMLDGIMLNQNINYSSVADYEGANVIKTAITSTITTHLVIIASTTITANNVITVSVIISLSP